MSSQHGEDLIVQKILQSHNVGVGRLCDIGAWGPRDLSNSRLFIDLGWQAVLVEFSPHAVEDLVREYGNDPHIKIVQVALTTEPQHVEKFEITNDSLSSNDPIKLSTWKDKGGYYGSLWVPTLTLQLFLQQFAGDFEFDFVDIDTEGSSASLAIEYLRLRDPGPIVMCIEHDDRIVEVMAAAQEKGYTMRWANGTNMIIAR